MKFRFFLIYAGVIVLALSFGVVPALAHHGWAGNLDEEFQISGTVESPVSLAGPHATMKIRADGHVWDLTLAPPARTADAGLREGIIPVGAKVTIHGQRNRDPKQSEDETETVTRNSRA